ncbi:MAG: hypothetical protein ABR555_15310 [Pyrinomonadaceae bacterium]
MTTDEVKAHFPQVVFGRADDFGVAKTTINPSFDTSVDKAAYQGVRSISLDFLDTRLTSIWIGFDETFQPNSLPDFVKQISQSFHLPDAWTSARNRGQQMRCSDFHVSIGTISANPTLRLLDTSADDTIAQRRQDKEEKDSAAAADTSENTDSSTTSILADKHHRTYYSAGCLPSSPIPEADKVVFASPEEARRAGFKAAKTCH